MNPADFISQFSPIDNPVRGVRLPTIQLEEKYLKELNLPKETSNFDFLRALCKKGFLALNLKKGSKEYDEYAARIKYELDTLNELGMTDYVLLVWDVINFCKENSIPTGPGRGSAASSIVLFLIGVTKIDSIKYGLYFERFVSKTRAKKTIIDGITYLEGSLLMDIDEDFDYYRRSEVLKYIETKYPGKVCKILTINTLSSKLLIKEVGKVLGMKQEDEMTMVTSMIPKTHGIVAEIADAIDGTKDEKGEWNVKPVPELKKWCEENSLVYDTVLKLNNLNKNKSCHASGILISYDNLEDCCPTELTSDKELISSYEMNLVSSFAVKLDALGLRAVSVIDDCCKALGIKPEDINVDDLSIYRALQDFQNPHGIFQLEADLAFRTTQKVKPKNFQEISAILALARPGAMKFIDDYAKFSNHGILPDFDIYGNKTYRPNPTLYYWSKKNPTALFTGVRETTRVYISIDEFSSEISSPPYQIYKTIIPTGSCTISGIFTYTGEAESAIVTDGIMLSGASEASSLTGIFTPIYISDVLQRLPSGIEVLPSGSGISPVLPAPSYMKKRKNYFQITGGDYYIETSPVPTGFSYYYNAFLWPAWSDLALLNPTVVYEQMPPDDGNTFLGSYLTFSASQGQNVGTGFNPTENVTYQVISQYAFLDSTATNALYNTGKCIFSETAEQTILNSGNLSGILTAQGNSLTMAINLA